MALVASHSVWSLLRLPGGVGARFASAEPPECLCDARSRSFVFGGDEGSLMMTHDHGGISYGKVTSSGYLQVSVSDLPPLSHLTLFVMRSRAPLSSKMMRAP